MPKRSIGANKYAHIGHITMYINYSRSRDYGYHMLMGI